MALITKRRKEDKFITAYGKGEHRTTLPPGNFKVESNETAKHLLDNGAFKEAVRIGLMTAEDTLPKVPSKAQTEAAAKKATEDAIANPKSRDALSAAAAAKKADDAATERAKADAQDQNLSPVHDLTEAKAADFLQDVIDPRLLFAVVRLDKRDKVKAAAVAVLETIYDRKLTEDELKDSQAE